METITLTVQVEREHLSDGQSVYVALCLELDLACQGATVEEATENVTDAVKSFFEVASPSEIERHLPFSHSDSVFKTRIEVPLGKTASLVEEGSGRRYAGFYRAAIRPGTQFI